MRRRYASPVSALAYLRHEHSGSCVTSSISGSRLLGAACELSLNATASAGHVPLRNSSFRGPTISPRAFRAPFTFSPNSFATRGQTTRDLGPSTGVRNDVFGKPCLHLSPCSHPFLMQCVNGFPSG
eukprot:2345884-Pyramimonas_sp.AAC.1